MMMVVDLVCLSCFRFIRANLGLTISRAILIERKIIVSFFKLFL